MILRIDTVREQLDSMKKQSLAAFGQVKAGEGDQEVSKEEAMDGQKVSFICYYVQSFMIFVV